MLTHGSMNDSDANESALRRHIFWGQLGTAAFLAFIAWVLPSVVSLAGGVIDTTLPNVMFALAAMSAFSGVATLLGYPLGGD